MKAIKYSRQRECIKTCLMNRTDHPTADALYLSIRSEFPNISLGTVYRNPAGMAPNISTTRPSHITILSVRHVRQSMIFQRSLSVKTLSFLLNLRRAESIPMQSFSMVNVMNA